LNIRFSIKPNTIDKIEADVKDGMLYITVIKKDNKPKINIDFK
jgi:HSP20 family molecular chaperone IbpA